MSINFPNSLDTFPNPAGTTLLADGTALHNVAHSDTGDAIEALEAKIGLGSGTPVLNTVLKGTGNGTSTWGTISGVYVTVGTANADYITDGTADDVQIQQAIDAVNTAGGGVVLIKAGDYNLGLNNVDHGSYIWLMELCPYYGINLKSNVHIIGEGVGATRINGPAIPGGTLGTYFEPIVNLSPMSNTSIEKLSLLNPTRPIGDTNGYMNGGIYFSGASHLILRDLYMTNGARWRIDGSSYTYNSTTKILTSDAMDILIDNVNQNVGLGSNMLFWVVDLTIRNCTQWDWMDDPILIAEAAQNILIDGYTYDGHLFNGVGGSNGVIYVNNDSAVSTDPDVLSNIRIVNSTISRHLCSLGGDLSGVELAGCKDISIENTTIEQCKYGINGGGSKVIGLRVNNCVIRNNRQQGFYFPDAAGMQCKNWNISNNKVYNNTGNAFSLSTSQGTSVVGLTFIGNEAFDNQGTATQTSGFSMGVGTANANDIIFVGNNSYDMAAGDTISGSIVSIKIKSNIGIADN